jgi:hypothetical protein
MLDRRARAFLQGDEDAFMATVANLSKPFVARQRKLLRDARGVDFASYRLIADWERYGDLVTPSIARRYPEAEAVAIPQIEERYRLEGFDAKPATEDLYYTLVRIDGRWLVANDTDLDGLTFYTTRHMWDYGPIDPVRSGHFLLLTHPCRSQGPCGRAPDNAVDLADAAIDRVERYWPVPWRKRVAILVPRGAHQLERMLQATFDVDNFVAFATSSVDVRKNLDYTGHRIILNPEAFQLRPEESTLDILSHELLHVASREVSGPFVPVFIEEGLAEYVGTDEDPSELAFFDSEVNAGNFDGRLPEDFQFTIGSGVDIFRSYQKSLSAVRFFIHTWGTAKFVRFYRVLGRVKIAPGTARYHLSRALRKTIGQSLARFEQAWASSITS